MKAAALCVLVVALLCAGSAAARPAAETLLLSGTVVTMDDARRVISNGRVLVRGGLISAVWSGRTPPDVDLEGARRVDAGPRGLIFPGLINLHDHPPFSVLPTWPVPSTHAQPEVGRPTGRESYSFRYQWTAAPPPEFRRLVQGPRELGDTDTLGLLSAMLVHAQADAALAGETATQGSPSDPANGAIVRDVSAMNFGRDRVEERVPTVSSGFGDAPALAARIAAGTVDAWLVHLAEGVRDGDRPAGDTFSSRSEFDVISKLGLLTPATVVVHGTALERRDFGSMRTAGSHLVWSPLSNLRLYGKTANVYEALAEGVAVSLGTDWTPTGSRTLLDELKIAEVTLRDRRLLGGSRRDVPALASDLALDRTLVEMVTTNPADALQWAEVGSIEPGKHADLLVLRHPAKSPIAGRRGSVYRSLIDATQKDVRLVLVAGRPVAGDVDAMRAAGARTMRTVRSPKGGFTKAVALRSGRGSLRGLSLTAAETSLTRSLRALGGDGARAASGPASRSATFSYLRARWNGGRHRQESEATFRGSVIAPRFGFVGSRLNLERIELSPLFTIDDRMFFAAVEGRRTVAAPSFRLYPANVNHARSGGNPFAGFQRRWYR